MNAHIISIGDELLIGQTVNTNASSIGRKLSDINIIVKMVSTIGDDETAILKEFNDSWEKNDLIIVTGGLGPTHDDITRSCVVKFFNTELIEKEDVLSDIKSLIAKRGRTISNIIKGQALVPKIAQPIRNQNGTAPGYWIEKDGKIFVVLPGVPYEMQGMMESFVVPKLTQLTSKEDFVIKKMILLTTGIGESILAERLGNLDELLQGAKLAFLPSQISVKLRVTVQEENEETAKNKLIEIEQKIRSKVGRYIFSREDEVLENVVSRLLIERELRLAVAESCTGGYLSSLLTDISGSSKYYDRGVIAYCNAAKVEILKVDEDKINAFGAVSFEVARQMAEGVKSISGSDIGISLTGILGPTGGSAEKPVGLVYIGLCDDKVCTAKKFLFGDNRLRNKQRAAQAALEMLRRHLLGITFDE